MSCVRLDFTGKRFGRLTAIKVHHRNDLKQLVWLCKCDCGNKHLTVVSNLKNGHTRSCGCLRKEEHHARHLKHGEIVKHKPSPEYQTYNNAKGRCNNPKNSVYRYYGGRGIQFLFTSFEQFLADVGRRPSPKHSIDRINNNGHYEPGNMRWATRSEQVRNRRAAKLALLKFPG
jgi:hypothetical protein